jgi:group I intron endonuclease
MITKVVYQITFQDATGKQLDKRYYIGSTINYSSRRSAHLDQLKNNKHSNTQLQEAFNIYPENTIHFQILQECADSKDLGLLEQKYITSMGLDSLFNIVSTVYPRPPSLQRSLEVREKISIGVKKGQTIEGRKRISEAAKAQVRTKKWNDNIGKVKQGELNENAKLSAVDVYFIKGMSLAGFKRKDLSAYYGVSINQIRLIAVGLQWQSVQYP